MDGRNISRPRIDPEAYLNLLHGLPGVLTVDDDILGFGGVFEAQSGQSQFVEEADEVLWPPVDNPRIQVPTNQGAVQRFQGICWCTTMSTNP
jgi:hypothetical protein